MPQEPIGRPHAFRELGIDPDTFRKRARATPTREADFDLRAPSHPHEPLADGAPDR